MPIPINPIEHDAKIEVRASSLNMLKHCPAAPHLLSVKKEEKDNIRKIGTIKHKWIELAINQDVNNADEWLKLKHQNIYKDIIEELHVFWSWLPISTMGGQTEQYLEMDLSTVKLTGHVDFLKTEYGDLTIIDWKTGEGQKYILPPLVEDLQLLAYAVLASNKHDITNIRLMRVRTTDCEYDELILDREILFTAKTLVSAVLDKYDQDTCTIGPHCESCLARLVCPARSEMPECVTDLVAIDDAPRGELTHPQFVRYALARGALKERIKDLDKMLKDYISDGGIIEHSGKILTVKSVKKEYIKDDRAVIEIIKKEIPDQYEAALKISKSSVNDAYKSAGLKTAKLWQLIKELGLIDIKEEDRMDWIKAK